MYMPLCRDCHRRESKFNVENAYSGDPTVISVEHENLNKLNQNAASKSSPSNTDADTANSLSEMNDSSATKSFSSDCESADEATLR